MTMNTTWTPTNAIAASKSDSTIQTGYRLWVGTGGDVALMPLAQGPSGTAVTMKAVATGKMLDVAFCKIMSTNTTASNFVIWF